MNTQSQEIKPEMHVCEVKGDEACARGELEYALDLYEDALALQPESLSLRGKLRKTQIRARAVRDSQKKRTASTFVQLALARLKKKPMEALQNTERLMRHDPFDRRVVSTLLDVADKAGCPAIGTQALEILLEEDPESEFLLRLLADRKRNLGDVQGEYRYLSSLAKLRETDAALTHRLKDAAARAILLGTEWKEEETNR